MLNPLCFVLSWIIRRSHHERTSFTKTLRECEINLKKDSLSMFLSSLFLYGLFNLVILPLFFFELGHSVTPPHDGFSTNVGDDWTLENLKPPTKEYKDYGIGDIYLNYNDQIFSYKLSKDFVEKGFGDYRLFKEQRNPDLVFAQGSNHATWSKYFLPQRELFKCGLYRYFNDDKSLCKKIALRGQERKIRQEYLSIKDDPGYVPWNVIDKKEIKNVLQNPNRWNGTLILGSMPHFIDVIKIPELISEISGWPNVFESISSELAQKGLELYTSDSIAVLAVVQKEEFLVQPMLYDSSFRAIAQFRSYNETALVGNGIISNKIPVEIDLIETRDHKGVSTENLHKGADIIHRKIHVPKKYLYVHCKSGKGRSATIIIAYLMKYQGLRRKQAIKLLKTFRPIVNIDKLSPHYQSLKRFEKSIQSKWTSKSLSP